MSDVRQCIAMYWHAENHGVQCQLPFSHMDEGTDHQFGDTPDPKFKIMIECEVWCGCPDDAFGNNPREIETMSDPVQAIEKAAMLRDNSHITWIEIVK